MAGCADFQGLSVDNRDVSPEISIGYDRRPRSEFGKTAWGGEPVNTSQNRPARVGHSYRLRHFPGRLRWRLSQAPPADRRRPHRRARQRFRQSRSAVDVHHQWHLRLVECRRERDERRRRGVRCRGRDEAPGFRVGAADPEDRRRAEPARRSRRGHLGPGSRFARHRRQDERPAKRRESRDRDRLRRAEGCPPSLHRHESIARPAKSRARWPRRLRPQGGKTAVFVGTAAAANARERREGFFAGAGELVRADRGLRGSDRPRPGPDERRRRRSASIPTPASSSASGRTTPTSSPRRSPSSPSCGRKRPSSPSTWTSSPSTTSPRARSTRPSARTPTRWATSACAS